MVKMITKNINLTACVRTEPLRIRTLDALSQTIKSYRCDGQKIGFVPTMGALHQGHLNLVKHAKSLCDKVVVSIFVNPMQFAPHEDLGRYPRQEDKDVAALAEIGCDLVYLPSPDIIYPQGFVSLVHVGGPSQGLESDARPQFFDGVTTVVMKLFNQVSPDLCVFGEKDYQQLMTIKTMVRDFNMALSIIGHPTTRADDGLALSSRNAYLSQVERAIAPNLYRVLQQIAELPSKGIEIDEAIETAKAQLLASGFGSIDYLVARDAEHLGEIDANTKERRLLVAAWLGKTRLIDNIGF